MRGNPDFQGAMFSYISLEERVPAAHPLRKLRAVVDALLATMITLGNVPLYDNPGGHQGLAYLALALPGHLLAFGALAGALPLLLGALGRNASQPAGAESLFGALERDHAGSSDLGGLLGSVLGKGSALARYDLYATTPDEDLAAIQAVTAAAPINTISKVLLNWATKRRQAGTCGASARRLGPCRVKRA